MEMAVRLNQRAFAHAKRLIEQGLVVQDEPDAWNHHRPTAQRENRFFEEIGLHRYRVWFLGYDEDEDEDSQTRYRFPVGDFERVHRCAVFSVEARAGQYRYADVQEAAAHLRALLDAIAARPAEQA